MILNPRQSKIFLLLREEGQAKVSFLSKTFNVTEPTIRQDLAILENKGLIVKVHGGAILKNVSEQVRTLSLEHKENMVMKSMIGKKAASLVNNGDSIILDAGSTTTEMAKNLIGKINLAVVTNSLNIALLLGSIPSIEIQMPGGGFRAPTLSLGGDLSSDFFSKIHADKLFLAAVGFSFESGVTTPGLNDLSIKKAMIKSAEKVFLIIDSTKIGKTSFGVICGLSDIHAVITDSGISKEQQEQFRKEGIQLVIADEE